MKYLISCFAALIVVIGGINLVYAGDAKDNPGVQGAGVAVQNSAEEDYFSGSGFSSHVESYAQGNVPSKHGSSIKGYSFFDEPNGHDYSIEDYLFFTGSGFTS